MKIEEVKNVITVGASAGGLSAVSELLASLPGNIDAAVFIVIHISKVAIEENILSLLNKKSKLEVVIPQNGTKIENRKAYLAPVDHHMMLSNGTILTTRGAKENHWRPSIDVLFRTAAAAYSNCVTGIILTGLLDDGTSGMIAIKNAGGTCIVQEPEEAEYADMPQSVINNIEVDYRVSIVDMHYILSDLYSRGICVKGEVPANLKLESEITLRMSSNYEQTSTLGIPTMFTCPDCGGVLTKIKEDGNSRYRCFTGHVYSEDILTGEYANKIEEALWVAIRMMEERRNFISGLEERTQINTYVSEDRKKRADELKVYIERLKDVLKDVGDSRITKL
ncbi:chemotaxis protein CheB [Pedobacter petrophilus]|nr:chemotaxis protein CheB [Pedobacter petrophilus]